MVMQKTAEEEEAHAGDTEANEEQAKVKDTEEEAHLKVIEGEAEEKATDEALPTNPRIVEVGILSAKV